MPTSVSDLKCHLKHFLRVITNQKNSQIIHPTIDFGSLFGLLSSVITLIFSVPVRDDYNIAGRYCEPEVDIPSRRNTLQLLAHPATYDRNYVSTLFIPSTCRDQHHPVDFILTF